MGNDPHVTSVLGTGGSTSETFRRIRPTPEPSSEATIPTTPELSSEATARSLNPQEPGGSKSETYRSIPDALKYLI